MAEFDLTMAFALTLRDRVHRLRDTDLTADYDEGPGAERAIDAVLDLIDELLKEYHG